MDSTNLDTQGVTADVLYPQSISPSFCCCYPHSLASKAGFCEQQPPPQTQNQSWAGPEGD